MMKKNKPWYLSKTIWGIVIAAGGTLLARVGVDVPVPENADYAQIEQFVKAFKDAQGSWSSIAGIAMTAVGFVLAVYGRIVAEFKIGGGEADPAIK